MLLENMNSVNFRILYFKTVLNEDGLGIYIKAEYYKRVAMSRM